MGHTFVYLQDAVQDCRAITIQLLADAQQGRQAVQVRGNQSRNVLCIITGSKTNFDLQLECDQLNEAWPEAVI